MSRIGKMPIEVPDKVTVEVSGRHVRVTGPRGTLERDLPPRVTVTRQGNVIRLEPSDPSREASAFHGLARTLLNNMVIGVTRGYTRVLEINGVGYKAEARGDRTLQFTLGFSHPVTFELPEGVLAEVEKGAKITLSSADKEKLGQVAAKIRSFRPPEPYKGKGIKYAEEVIRRKVGKAGTK